MEQLTKDDLRQFKMQLLDEIGKMLDEKMKSTTNELTSEWVRSRSVRKFLDIAPASLINLRITGKIRYKKVLKSYYYNVKDLKKLFEGEKK
ncbi:hypothetical protein QFZ37_003206 [Chryseobacterium ginsenosidimutans]|uniref:DNA-binding protein n=1 Tax=Chryseobacterium ginsenosidimutans TaxID=687846 RepID=UPI00277F13D1|nr:DNA-binding protein [Chryseobacterium ginsenosidimutans]MDQ0594837.1 hypothetical protein [Chryseobacterium ginsenosidimutans]